MERALRWDSLAFLHPVDTRVDHWGRNPCQGNNSGHPPGARSTGSPDTKAAQPAGAVSSSGRWVLRRSVVGTYIGLSHACTHPARLQPVQHCKVRDAPDPPPPASRPNHLWTPHSCSQRADLHSCEPVNFSRWTHLRLSLRLPQQRPRMWTEVRASESVCGRPAHTEPSQSSRGPLTVKSSLVNGILVALPSPPPSLAHAAGRSRGMPLPLAVGSGCEWRMWPTGSARAAVRAHLQVEAKSCASPSLAGPFLEHALLSRRTSRPACGA